MSARPFNRYRLGIIGGLGPLASADLYEKVTRLTPAASDQDHFETVLLSIPQTPDRTAAVMGSGPSPLPHLLEAIATLNRLRVELVAIGCNTAHHWYDELAIASSAPILHIADAAIAQLEVERTQSSVAVLATRGVIASGFYQRKLHERGFNGHIPNDELQSRVDVAIAAVKAGDLAVAAQVVDAIVSALDCIGTSVALLACTELPIAWSKAAGTGKTLSAVDVNQAFAKAIVHILSSNGFPQASGCGQAMPVMTS